MMKSTPEYCVAIVFVFALALTSAHSLYYDFDDGQQGWEQINGQVKAENGVLVVSSSDDDDSIAIMPGSDWNDSWTNYTVETKMTIAEGPDNGGLLLRYQAPDTYYIFAIVNGRQRMEIWSRVAGAYTDELDIDFASEIGQDYIVRVVAEGSDFKVYIDDELIAEWSDNKLATGKAGVRTYSSVSHFDHILITGAGIPTSDGEPGTSAVEPASKLAATWANIKD